MAYNTVNASNVNTDGLTSINNLNGSLAANVSVAISATTTVVTGLTQADTAYAVSVTPSWATTVYITSKSATGFTINYGTAPIATGSVDWFVRR